MAEKGDSPYNTDLSEIIETDPVTPEDGDSPYDGGGLSPLNTNDSQTFLEYLQGLLSIEAGLRSSGDSILQDQITTNADHTTSDGKDHSDVVLNNTHRESDGKDHSDVVLNNTHRGSDGKDHSDVVLNNTHRGSDGKDHSDVGLNNTHRGSDGKDHSDVVLNNTHRGRTDNPHAVSKEQIAGLKETDSPKFQGLEINASYPDLILRGSHTGTQEIKLLESAEGEPDLGFGMMHYASSYEFLRIGYYDNDSNLNAFMTLTTSDAGGVNFSKAVHFASLPTVNGAVISTDDHDHNTEYEPKNNNIQTHIGDGTIHLSAIQKTDLTNGGESSAHYHPSDRARANHTGTQTASTISDFDTEVSNNSSVSNATSHIADNNKHREINDSGSGTTDLWSADKIASEISGSVEIEDTPVDGHTIKAISSNWAYDHGNSETGVHTYSQLEDILTAGVDVDYTTDNYINLPSGLQLRWGLMYTSLDSNQSYTFDTSFSTACITVISNVTGIVSSKTKTGFTFNRFDSITGAANVEYIAIGY